MGRNTGNGTRIGLIKSRKQAYNPRTKQYIKINTDTGKIMGSSSNKFKSIRVVKKKSTIRTKNIRVVKKKSTIRTKNRNEKVKSKRIIKKK